MILATRRPEPRGAISLRRGHNLMKLSRVIADFILDCRLRKLADNTIRGYELDLEGLYRVVLQHGSDSAAACKPELLARWIAICVEKGNGLGTLKRKRTVAEEFSKYGMRRRIWTASLTLDLPTYKPPERLPRPYERHEREALLGLELPLIERTMRDLLYHTGMRANEMLGLHVRDVMLPERRLRIIGKGNKERLAIIVPELDAVLREYLLAHPELTPPMFLFTKRDGSRWTYGMLRYRVRQWARSAGVPDGKAHRLRHTAATELFEAGADPRAAQRAMGHASLATTMLYTKVYDSEVEKAALLRAEMQKRRAELRDGVRKEGE